jgi:hypothetical protein
LQRHICLHAFQAAHQLRSFDGSKGCPLHTLRVAVFANPTRNLHPPTQCTAAPHPLPPYRRGLRV